MLEQAVIDLKTVTVRPAVKYAGRLAGVPLFSGFVQGQHLVGDLVGQVRHAVKIHIGVI